MAFVLKEHGAQSWQWNPAAETITVTPIAEGGTAGTDVPDVKGAREDINFRQLREFAAIGMEPGDSIFHVWASTLDGYVPKSGDKITDSDNQAWTIMAVTGSHTEPRFICPVKTRY